MRLSTAFHFPQSLETKVPQLLLMIWAIDTGWRAEQKNERKWDFTDVVAELFWSVEQLSKLKEILLFANEGNIIMRLQKNKS